MLRLYFAGPYLIDTRTMIKMSAFYQLPNLLVNLVLAQTDQAAVTVRDCEGRGIWTFGD